MITYINGSPKLNNSASNKFLNDIKNIEDNTYYIYKDKYEDIINSIINSKTIVIAFPLYADSPTSGVLDFLEYVENNDFDLSNKNLYVVVNCGFFEPEQNETAFRIIKCFCDKKQINFMGGLSIGAGPIIGIRDSKKIYKLLSMSYYKKISLFKNAIYSGEKIDLDMSLSLNKIIYVCAANISWKNTINHANKK